MVTFAEVVDCQAEVEARPRFSLFSLHDNYSGQRSLETFYGEAIEMCEYAEELGFFGFFVAEHHFRESGTCPNPAVFLSHLAARTKRIRLGPAVSVLSLRDPRNTAEDYLLLDLLSGGRCMLGVGSGAFRFEFDGFGIPFDEKRGRFEEALAIVRQAISGTTIEFAGRHHRASGARMNIPPMLAHAKHLPLYVAGISRQSAYQIGKAGDNLMNTPFISLGGGESIDVILEHYRNGLGECRPMPDTEVAILMHCHVAHTDDEARRRAQQAFETYVASRTDPQAPRKSYDEVAASAVTLFGSTQRVADRVVELVRLGVDHIILFKNFGAMPLNDVKDSMALFMREVAPATRQFARRPGATA